MQKKINCTLTDMNLEFLAQKSERYTGADVTGLFQEAVNQYISRAYLYDGHAREFKKVSTEPFMFSDLEKALAHYVKWEDRIKKTVVHS